MCPPKLRVGRSSRIFFRTHRCHTTCTIHTWSRPELVYVDEQGVEWPSAPEGASQSDADASPFGSQPPLSPLTGQPPPLPPLPQQQQPGRDSDPVVQQRRGSGSGSGRRASGRQGGGLLETVDEHAAGCVRSCLCEAACSQMIMDQLVHCRKRLEKHTHTAALHGGAVFCHVVFPCFFFARLCFVQGCLFGQGVPGPLDGRAPPPPQLRVERGQPARKQHAPQRPQRRLLHV